MPYTAAIRRHPNSQFWQAQFWAWDEKKGEMGRVMKSTKCSNPKKAQQIAEEFQEFAIKVSKQDGSTRITREFVLQTLNDILRLAGHRTVAETRQWDEYSVEWLELQRPRLAPRSLESYQGHIRLLTHWLESEASTALNVLDGATLQNWYFDMLDEGRKPATVNNAVKTLQAVFDRARAEGFCPRNPAELILRQYGEKDIRQPFTAEDLAKILSHLRTTRQTDWLTVALLGICTGQRLQDCANATLTDFTAPTKTAPAVWHLRQGKTKTLVHIPIVEPLASHLQSLHTRPDAQLAPSLHGRPTGGSKCLSSQFSTILESAGVARVKREREEDSKGRSFTDKTFHSFRHTTNSLLAEAGITDDVRRKITGHSSTAMNQIYTHLAASTLANALKRAISSSVS